MKKLSVFFVMLVIIFTIGWTWYIYEISPVNQNTTQQSFTIDKGESTRQVTSALFEKGLIRNTIAFFAMIKLSGLDGKIQAGDFELSPSMSAQQIAKTLTVGTSDVRVTIPEGLRAEEIADILRAKFSHYDDSWRKTLDTHEGYLFPDTYLFPKDATSVEIIIQRMRDTFDVKYNETQATQTTSLTKQQTVILASIIEREAKFPEDRPLVASVLINRINLGMALQVDSSIQYTLGYQPIAVSWWKKNLTADDLKISSPYNTYLTPGLPPAPICNPGLASLQAALNPAKTNYLYYLSDSTGHLHFAQTLDQHNANIRKYGL